MVQFHPSRVPGRGFDAGRYELNTFQPIVDGWIDHILRHCIARFNGGDGRGSLGVDIGKSLQIAFGMARRNTGYAGCAIACPGTVASDQALGFSEGRVPKVVGILLCPLKATLVAIHPDSERIFVAGATWLHHSIPLAPPSNRSMT